MASEFGVGEELPRFVARLPDREATTVDRSMQGNWNALSERGLEVLTVRIG